MQSFFVLYPIMASISELYKKHNHNNSYTFYKTPTPAYRFLQYVEPNHTPHSETESLCAIQQADNSSYQANSCPVIISVH